jgi:hypothetical protein
MKKKQKLNKHLMTWLQNVVYTIIW